MDLVVRDVGPIEAVDLPLPKPGQITLVGALNEQGKTTLVRCLGAVLTRNPAPITGVKKTDGPAMVRKIFERDAEGYVVHDHEGQPRLAANTPARGSAAIVMGDRESFVSVGWPKCELSEKGKDLPQAGRLAVGTARFGEMATADRAKVLGDVYKLEVTRKDLVAALDKAGVKDRPKSKGERGDDIPALFDQFWAAVQTQGWDKAAENAVNRARVSKTVWQDTTGETWGASKAEGWLPHGWRAELAKATREDLQAAVTQAQAVRDQAAAAELAAGERRRDLQAKVDLKAEAVKRHGEAVAAGEAASHKVKLTYEEVAKYPSGEHPEQPCPHCGSHVAVMPDGKLVIPPTLNTMEMRARAVIAWNAAKAEAGDAVDAIKLAEADLRVVERAEAELKAIIGAAPKAAAIPLAEAAEALQRAQVGLSLWEKREKAALHHRNVVDFTTAAKVMGADGVRKERTASILGLVNAWLKDLSDAAGFASPVRIEADLSVTRSGLPYESLSESARWRVDAVLQVELARRQGVPFVILDRADLNDQAGRDGLIGMLIEAGVGALVCMTFFSPESVPDLGAHGLGQSWWLADGTITALGDAALTPMQQAAE